MCVKIKRKAGQVLYTNTVKTNRILEAADILPSDKSFPAYQQVIAGLADINYIPNVNLVRYFAFSISLNKMAKKMQQSFM